MKINTEQLNALMQEQTKKTSSNNGASGFDDLLMQEMQTQQSSVSSGAGQTTPLAQPGVLGISALLQTQNIAQANGEQEIVNSLHGVLDQWDSYAEKLGSSESNLRSAYTDLETIAGKMSELKDSLSKQADASPELDALCNEMDVLTVTETFKFNRGDYSV